MLLSKIKIPIGILGVGSIIYIDYPYAYQIRDIEMSGLPKQSYVLANKELLVHNDMSCEAFGRLSEADLKNVNLLHDLAVLKSQSITQKLD